MGLDAITQRYRLTDTINDLKVERLGPYTQATASRFLQALAEEYRMEFSAELIQAVCSRAGWLIPYHLQILFAGLRDVASERNEPSNPTHLDEAWRRLLHNASYFDHWHARLKDLFTATEQPRALTVLQLCANDERGAPLDAMKAALSNERSDVEERQQSLRWILEVLENDGYLRQDPPKRYAFRSNLLRSFWQARYCDE